MLVHVTTGCPVCAGSGEVADYYNGYVGCWETKRCNACDGSGDVKVERAAELREEIANPPEWDGP